MIVQGHSYTGQKGDAVLDVCHEDCCQVCLKSEQAEQLAAGPDCGVVPQAGL